MNLSSRQLAGTDVIGLVTSTLEVTGLDPSLLRLELTEETLVDAQDVDPLKQLAALGVALDLDDFGTGYSSLSYLTSFPLHGLKIDRSFIAGLEEARGQSVIRAILAMGDPLELELTAEGIETGLQRDRLIELGCPFGQGYLFGRAMPESAARARLRGP